MENNNEEFIINTKNQLDNLFIYSKWIENEILFKIIDENDKNWTGSIQLEEIKEIALELEIEYNIFINEIKNSLIKSTETFLYEIEHEKFLLKKNGDLKIIYLEINLILLNEDLKNDFLIKSTEINSINYIKLLEITQKYKHNSDELIKLKADIEKVINDHNKSEEILLSKFSMLLNTKKDEISKLKELVYEKDQTLGISHNSCDDTTDDELDSYTAPTQALPSTQKVINLPRRKK